MANPIVPAVLAAATADRLIQPVDAPTWRKCGRAVCKETNFLLRQCFYVNTPGQPTRESPAETNAKQQKKHHRLDHFNKMHLHLLLVCKLPFLPLNLKK